ncbi:putative tumor necrosis factor receptor superfamily member 9-like [Triplophysa rosa]|uniref:Tumor necrosis factor receptor superfamily member 9-like n=1 Tax=Triplophysa rosa TaxID=992332 RepID=A0A9W7WS50_TRIRA|nr:putative tumor necrosis factor receptor superfamily member 9-like [Triplophysa rosa]
MFRHIEILSALFCLLLLYHNVNTKLCPAGQRKIYGQDKCEDCPKEQYSTNKGEEIVCLHCSKCKEGSEIDVKCNPTRDTRCRCKPGYTPVDMLKQTFCICEVGYGLEHAGKLCIKCIHGFFSNKQNSDCQKWKECKSGIRIPGNNTSDAVCNPVIATSTPKTITTSYIATDVHKVISTSTPKTITTSYIATDVHTVISTLTPKPQNKDRFYILCTFPVPPFLLNACICFLLEKD